MLGKIIRNIIPTNYRPVGYLNETIRKLTNCQVSAGPFKGLKYVKNAYYSVYIPKLLGIYERELYPVIEKAVESNFPVIVDIGAAEGYFACGMGLRCKTSKVIAYEGAEGGQKLLKEMVQMNGLESRVEIRGYCDRAQMQSVLQQYDRALLIVDCEGYEHILLDPMRCPELSKASILVECHDFLVVGLTEELESRFAATHHIEKIWQTDRPASEYPVNTLYTKILGQKRLEWAVSEWRPVRMWWLWITPR